MKDGDRPDNLASQYFGDPELFWRLCDANEGMHPNELIETVGRKLRITLPEGFKTTQNDSTVDQEYHSHSLRGEVLCVAGSCRGVDESSKDIGRGKM